MKRLLLLLLAALPLFPLSTRETAAQQHQDYSHLPAGRNYAVAGGTQRPAESVVSAVAGPMATDVEPVLEQPLSVRIEGNSVALIARHTTFTAVTTGSVSSIMWSVTTTDGKPLDPPTTIEGTGRKQVKFGDVPGVYQINVAVGGRDGGVHMAHYRHEVVDDREPLEQPPPQQPPPAPNPLPGQQPAESVIAPQAMHQQTNNLEPYVQRLALSVPSGARVAEAKIVGGCFRQVVTAIESGTFTGAGPLFEVQQQAAIALGSAAPAWVGFFAGIDGLITAIKAAGAPGDPASIAPLLSEIASALARL